MKKFNTSYLPYIGAFAQAVLFSFAGVQAFGAWGWAIGPGVGITASLSVAVASSGIGSITAKGRKQLATAGLILMGVFSASTVSLSLAAPESVWCAISWGCAVDVSIVLAGAISGKGLVAQDNAQSVAGAEKVRKSSRKSAEPVAPPAQSIAPASKYPHECGLNGCTYIIKNAQSVGGHMKAKHPASLGIFEPVTKETYEVRNLPPGT
jgi:hypothetical protein